MELHGKYKGAPMPIQVDEQDFGFVIRYDWMIHKSNNRSYETYYALTKIDGKTVHMHNLLLPAYDSNLTVDHIDHDGLNNRMSNLRLVTQSQNCMRRRKRTDSSSKYKGVSWSVSRGKWCACIQYSGHHINLGRFDCEEDAARAYDKAAKTYFKEFAVLNLPTSS